MTMITPSYLGETIEYSSLHACRSTLEDPTTAPFQDVFVTPVATGSLLGTTVTFQRAKNPHAGCFFLNARQMPLWSTQPYFLDRDTSFIGPLESAATLSVMRTFRIYKPAPECAGFLEIEHFRTGFLGNLRRRGDAKLGQDCRRGSEEC